MTLSQCKEEYIQDKISIITIYSEVRSLHLLTNMLMQLPPRNLMFLTAISDFDFLALSTCHQFFSPLAAVVAPESCCSVLPAAPDFFSAGFEAWFFGDVG